MVAAVLANGLGAPRVEVHARPVASTGYVWDHYNLTYGIVNLLQSAGMPDGGLGAMTSALAQWQAQVPLTFTPVADLRDADVRIQFASVDGRSNCAGAGGTLGLTYVAPPGGGTSSGLVTLDWAESWADVGGNPSCQPVNVNSVLLHEIGHALGLAHSSVVGSVMHETYNPRLQVTQLQPDDVASIRALYPGDLGWRPPAWESAPTPNPSFPFADGGPAITTWRGGHLELFYRGRCQFGVSAAQLCHTSVAYDSAHSEQWTGPEFLGRPPGGIASDPSAISWGPGRLSVVVRGADSRLYWRNYMRPPEGGGWSAWAEIPGGGTTTDSPAAATMTDGHLEVFVRGTDPSGQLYHNYTTNGGWDWSGWLPLGSNLTSAPTATSWGNGRMDVFARGTDNALWHTFYAGQWWGWESLGGILAGPPGAQASPLEPGVIHVYVAGIDPGNPVYHFWQAGSWWVEYLGGQVGGGPSRPGAVSFAAGRTDVYVQGTDSRLYRKYWGLQGVGL